MYKVTVIVPTHPEASDDVSMPCGYVSDLLSEEGSFECPDIVANSQTAESIWISG